MDEMKSKVNYAVGLRFGIIAFLLYCVLLFLRYHFFAASLLSLLVFTFVSYLIILIVFFLTGYYRKKEQGGFAEFREIFQSIFIAILLAELGYLIFNLIYLKYVDPEFFNKFKQSMRVFLENANQSDEVIDQQMDKIKDMSDQLKPLNQLKGLGVNILIDSVFGMIFAAILRKKKEVFDTQ